MKKFFTILAMMASATSFAQKAPDWTATDCNGNSHNLYKDLDSGKVVVMVWVMPCSFCVNGAKAAYKAVQMFEASNPGKVKLYLSDDFGDITCANLQKWIDDNNIGTGITIFDNVGMPIDENDWGGSGMPHIAVVAGADRKIYYEEHNGNAGKGNEVENAIFTAIGALKVSDTKVSKEISISPNPVTDVLHISAAKPLYSVTITALNGQVVRSETFANGKMNPAVDMSGLASGMYIIAVSDTAGEADVILQKVTKK